MSEETVDPRFRQVCGEMLAGLSRLAVPGGVVAVLHEGQEHVAGFGVTNVEHPLPVTGDTLFQIGSITKTFTASALMRLVERGLIDLDAPVRAYLPGLRLADESVAARVTARHLLTHTGGWVGDSFTDFGPGEDALARMADSLACLPQLTPLGALWSYNNTGFCLAGRLIEAVTGMTFERAMKELVFAPLRLESTYFFAHELLTRRFAVGHEVADGRAVIALPWALPRSVAPAGGIISNASDLLRYARSHMVDGTGPEGTRLLSPGSLAAMQTPVSPATGISMIGLSWFITHGNSVRIIGHSGATHGQFADLRIAPERECAVVVLANGSTGRSVCNEVSRSALNLFLDAGLSEPELLDRPKGALLAYTGHYDSLLATSSISHENGGLVLQLTYKHGASPLEAQRPSPPPVRIGFCDEDKIVVLDDPYKGERGEFLRGPDGRIAWLRFAARVFARQA
jgi:CubicO group peptidase (beta-lactamase class C family)